MAIIYPTPSQDEIEECVAFLRECNPGDTVVITVDSPLSVNEAVRRIWSHVATKVNAKPNGRRYDVTVEID